MKMNNRDWARDNCITRFGKGTMTIVSEKDKKEEKKMKLSEFIKKYGDCEVTEEMEKCIEKPKKGKWIPKKGEDYYYVDDCGYIKNTTYSPMYSSDRYRASFMRMFKTSDEANRYLEIMKACKEASLELDYGCNEQRKYFFTYNIEWKEVKVLNRYTTISGDKFFFESEEVAYSLINKFGEKDIIKYVLGVEMEG